MSRRLSEASGGVRTHEAHRLASFDCIILANWLYSAWADFLRPGEVGRPNSVSQLALFVCLKTAVVVGVVWPLLRANGKRLADLYGQRA